MRSASHLPEMRSACFSVLASVECIDRKIGCFFDCISCPNRQCLYQSYNTELGNPVFLLVRLMCWYHESTETNRVSIQRFKVLSIYICRPAALRQKPSSATFFSTACRLRLLVALRFFKFTMHLWSLKGTPDWANSLNLPEKIRITTLGTS